MARAQFRRNGPPVSDSRGCRVGNAGVGILRGGARDGSVCRVVQSGRTAAVDRWSRRRRAVDVSDPANPVPRNTVRRRGSRGAGHGIQSGRNQVDCLHVDRRTCCDGTSTTPPTRLHCHRFRIRLPETVMPTSQSRWLFARGRWAPEHSSGVGRDASRTIPWRPDVSATEPAAPPITIWVLRSAPTGGNLLRDLRREVVRWDMADPAAPRAHWLRSPGFPSYVNEINYSNDGTRFAAGTSDNTVRV